MTPFAPSHAPPSSPIPLPAPWRAPTPPQAGPAPRHAPPAPEAADSARAPAPVAMTRPVPLAPEREPTQLQSLHGSLLQDLLRFGPDEGHGLELLEVLAAALRHGRALSVQLQHGLSVWTTTVLPRERSARTPQGLDALLALPLSELRVLQVRTELRAAAELPGVDGSLPLLLWELALRGSRATLLPEIAGPAAYRIAPGNAFDGLPLTGTLALAVERLRRRPCALPAVAQWEGFDEDRAVRLINALYLQSALIVSRSTPAALHGD